MKEELDLLLTSRDETGGLLKKADISIWKPCPSSMFSTIGFNRTLDVPLVAKFPSSHLQLGLFTLFWLEVS